MDRTQEQAVETFMLVPEIYQYAYQAAGVDFPSELVELIKQDRDTASKLVEDNPQLLESIADIFAANQDAILDAAEKVKENTGVFKIGGKLQQGLEKYTKKK